MRILIVYATRHGTTRRVAGMVAGRLAAQGHTVEARVAGERPSPIGYDLVVLGAPVYGDGPCRGIMEYVEAAREELEEEPKAFFLVALHTVGSVFMGRLHGGIAYAQPLLDAFEAPPFYGTLIGGVLDPASLTEEEREKMERFYRALGEELRPVSRLREEDVDVFVRRMLLYYRWFGRLFKRSTMEEALSFSFIDAVRGGRDA